MGRAFGILTMLLTSVGVAYSADPILSDPRTMSFKPVEFSPPEPERVVLDNGLVVYLLEDHELPLVTITARMRTGSWLDPTDKIGLAGMTGAVMRTGGGGGFSAEQVDAELEQFAADVSIGIGRQSRVSVSRCLEQGCESRVGDPRRSHLGLRRSIPPVSSWPSYRPSRGSAAVRIIPAPSSAENSSRCSMGPIIRAREKARWTRSNASPGTISSRSIATRFTRTV